VTLTALYEAVNLIYVTHTACERDIRAALEELRGMDGMLLADPIVIRVED
jgi:homoserine dehydrogenase